MTRRPAENRFPDRIHNMGGIIAFIQFILSKTFVAKSPAAFQLPPSTFAEIPLRWIAFPMN